MSELSGRRKYIRLTEGQILVRPEQKTLVLRETEYRTIGVSQLMRELIDFGKTFGFFVAPDLTSENLPE